MPNPAHIAELKKRLPAGSPYDTMDFSSGDLSGEQFEGIEFIGCNFTRINARGAVFERCQFRNSSFVLSDMQRSKFIDCKFVGCSFKEADLSNAEFFCYFLQCSFGEIEFKRWESGDSREAPSGEWVRRGTNVRGTRFVGSSFEDCQYYFDVDDKTDFRGVSDQEVSTLTSGGLGIDYSNLPAANFERAMTVFHRDSPSTQGLKKNLWSAQTWQAIESLIVLTRNQDLDEDVITTVSEQLVARYNYYIFKDIPIGGAPRPTYSCTKGAWTNNVHELIYALPGETKTEQIDRLARAFWTLVYPDEVRT